MAIKLGVPTPRWPRSAEQLGLARVYWYTWASPYGRGGSVFNYSGLQAVPQRRVSHSPRWAPSSARRGSSRVAQKNAQGACR